MALPTLFALAAAVAAPAPLDAPVRAVTVYSDRARVTRQGAVDVSGTRTIELPVVARDLDPRTIAVSASGAELRRVDIVWAPADQLPREKVEEVLDAINKVDDQLAQLDAERNAWQTQLNLLGSLRPQLPSPSEPRPTPKLSSTGWAAAIEFTRARTLAAQAHLRTLTQRARPLALERQRLTIEAQKIGASVREAGYRVIAHLAGHGTAKVSMTYMVGRARWRPIYDLALDPATSQVDLQFAGEVSQETGEDWSRAQLALSTAEPATATRYPKVTTWKIGERERFIPTPVAQARAPGPPPPPELAANEQTRTSDNLALRTRLDQIVGRNDRKADEDDGAKGEFDRRGPMGAVGAATVRKELARDEPAPTEPAPAPEVPADAYAATSSERPESGRSVRFHSANIPKSPPPPHEIESVGLVAPRGWSRPAYAADLPASLAGGYDLVYSALQPETVLSGKGTRRVALLSRRWPVNIERKIFPALGPDAFLVAELKSRDDKPLPGGTGHLFVGSDPAGVAQLPLIRPSETVTLPLGLDRAIRPVRNVKVVTTQKGVISKDEINEYTVSIEIANPYPRALPVRVVDQIPIVGDTGAKNVEVKLTRAEPGPATKDDGKGTLEWHLTLPPSGKSTVTFVYTIKRPKGYELRQ